MKSKLLSGNSQTFGACTATGPTMTPKTVTALRPTRLNNQQPADINNPKINPGDNPIINQIKEGTLNIHLNPKLPTMINPTTSTKIIPMEPAANNKPGPAPLLLIMQTIQKLTVDAQQLNRDPSNPNTRTPSTRSSSLSILLSSTILPNNSSFPSPTNQDSQHNTSSPW